MSDWQVTAKEVEDAFASGSVLAADRPTLERWFVALCVGSHTFMREQEPMLRRLDALKHLLAVRLSEETDRRRQEQQRDSLISTAAHNRRALRLQIIIAVITFLSMLAAVIGAFIAVRSATRQPQRLETPAHTSP